MSTRLACLFLFLFLPAVAYAEPFEAWEDAGIIYGRDLADPDNVLRLSWFDDASTQPDVDGELAVWLHKVGWDRFAIYSHWFLDPATWDSKQKIVASSWFPMTDPQAGWVGERHVEWSYVVWRERGDLWHLPGDIGGPERPVQSIVLEDYAGPFDVTGHTLTYDGGTLNLQDFIEYRQIPEPGTWVLLVVALLCCMWHRR